MLLDANEDIIKGEESGSSNPLKGPVIFTALWLWYTPTDTTITINANLIIYL